MSNVARRRRATGDVLTVFSDGVSEALSTSGEEFGEANDDVTALIVKYLA